MMQCAVAPFPHPAQLSILSLLAQKGLEPVTDILADVVVEDGVVHVMIVTFLRKLGEHPAVRWFELWHAKAVRNKSKLTTLR